MGKTRQRTTEDEDAFEQLHDEPKTRQKQRHVDDIIASARRALDMNSYNELVDSEIELKRCIRNAPNNSSQRERRALEIELCYVQREINKRTKSQENS